MAIVQTSKIFRESVQGISWNFTGIIFVTLYQIALTHIDRSKNMAASGRSILPDIRLLYKLQKSSF